MNKYRAVSKRLARDRRRLKGCESKTGYADAESARLGNGNECGVYLCGHCHLWHRTQAAYALARKLSRTHAAVGK